MKHIAPPPVSRRLKRVESLLCGLVLCASLVTKSSAQGPDITVLERTTALNPETVGLARPGDGSSWIFTVAQDGYSEIWDGSAVRSPPFLDINGLVSTGGEQGLLGLAFHPQYATNRYFFVYYTDTTGASTIVRYETTAGDSDDADESTAMPILSFSQPAPNHNGGDLHFGSDGYLYISSGDGGGSGCVAQDNSNLLGKILRIDVDGDDFPMDPDRNYAIPSGNPFGNTMGAAPEIWVMGLRNPWRFSFDRATGDMFIGDVGEGDIEEFDYLPLGSQGGANLGWPWFEGDLALDTCAMPVGPFATCDDGPFTCPILQLPRSVDACSAIGGYRYRGADYPSLQGIYFFTDWCEGELHAGIEGGASWQLFDVGDIGGFGPTGFGEDDAGELYFVNGSGLYQVTGTYGGLFSDGFESGDTSAWSP